MSMRWISAIVAAAALAGCATSTSGGGGFAPPPPPPPSPAQAPVPAMRSFELARSFAGPRTYLAPRPTAIALIDGDSSQPRRAALCEGYLRLPELDEALARSVVEGNLIATRMPLAVEMLQADQMENCDDLMKVYDDTRAERIIARLGLGGRKGPFLVAVFADGNAEGGSPFVVADASDLDTAEIPGFVEAWARSMRLASERLLEGEDFAGAGPATAPACVEARPDSSATSCPAPSAGVCGQVEAAVGVAAPVVIEVARATFGSTPGVRLILGYLDRSGLEDAAEQVFQIGRDGMVSRLTSGAGIVCTRIRTWLQRWVEGPGIAGETRR